MALQAGGDNQHQCSHMPAAMCHDSPASTSYYQRTTNSRLHVMQHPSKQKQQHVHMSSCCFCVNGCCIVCSRLSGDHYSRSRFSDVCVLGTSGIGQPCLLACWFTFIRCIGGLQGCMQKGVHWSPWDCDVDLMPPSSQQLSCSRSPSSLCHAHKWSIQHGVCISCSMSRRLACCCTPGLRSCADSAAGYQGL